MPKTTNVQIITLAASSAQSIETAIRSAAQGSVIVVADEATCMLAGQIAARLGRKDVVVQLKPRYKLADLLASITPDNLNIDWDWINAPPVGREFPNEE